MNYVGGEYDTSAIYSAIQKQTVVRPHVDCEYFDGQQYIKVAKKNCFVSSIIIIIIFYYYWAYTVITWGFYFRNLHGMFFLGRGMGCI